jgi:hypothetical protein
MLRSTFLVLVACVFGLSPALAETRKATAVKKPVAKPVPTSPTTRSVATPFAASEESGPIYVTEIPRGYRDWRLISVAHEEGKLTDIRAILGNDAAVNAYRDGTLPFPDGTIIARLAWSYDPLEESSKAFGRLQSFVAGPPKNGVSLWSRTQASTPQPAAGASLNLTTANLLPKRCKTPAFPATRSSKLATLSSTVTLLRHRLSLELCAFAVARPSQ